MSIPPIRPQMPKTLVSRVATSKPFMNTVKTLGKNAPMLTVLSVVSKDLVGALVLFDQTLHNKKIPENKRKYLASYEITSGSYNVIFPLTVGFLYTSESFKHKSAKALFNKYYVDPKDLKAAVAPARDILEAKMKVFEKGNKGLAQFVAIIFTAIVSKRIIGPFVSGPMATIFREKVLSKMDDEKKTH